MSEPNPHAEVRPIEERYDVVRKIGEGASAETFLARDRQNDDASVVVKSLHVERLDGWKFFELFEREAQALRSIEHRGIPRFVESFASRSDDDRPRFHIVQEFIEGRSLAKVIEDGGLSAPEFDQLALGMLDVLHYLHGRTPPVFHRDIKPSNIIVSPMGAPVLIDFGSVCYGWRDEGQRGSTVAGTHGYMPPEQYMGQVSSRSDLYGLGATLLHVASGREPSEFSFDDGRLNVPESLPVRPEVRRAISELLQPAPRDRPQSAKEARALFIGEPSTALIPIAGQTALAVRSDDGITRLKNAHATRFVDLGDPPRDPAGEFRDVYKSLVPPFYAVMNGSEGVNRAHAQTTGAWIALYLFLTLGTFGLWPFLRLVGRAERARRDLLFRTGRFTRGTIVAVAAHNQISSRVTFDFQRGEERLRDSQLIVSADAGHMLIGEEYGVLYADADPANNTLVYR